MEYSEIPLRFKECVTHTDKEIKGFFGKYRWLSNFHRCIVVCHGKEFPSTEHAYMFSKLEDPTDNDYENVIAMTCRQVKNWGQKVPLRPDWEHGYKFRIMYEILQDKFSENNPDLKQKLLDTGDAYLEETNNWGDVVWGVDLIKGGKNRLGELIMNIRNNLRLQELFWT